jgi:hypothetical protein
MRLYTVQSFERKFNPETLKSYKKMKDYWDIDSTTMNAVASAFSNFASMPANKRNAERSGSGRTRNRYFQWRESRLWKWILKLF